MNYRFNEESMFLDITDGIAVIINSETGIYYGMNAFGTMVFEALIHGMTEESIQCRIEKMDTAPIDIGTRLDTFITELTKMKLIVPGKSGSEFDLDAEVAMNDNFVLELSAYDDIQEMLLADPIHEVKENNGGISE